jgi:glycosyltransferase involved in cell wall biosynthesis
MNIAVIGPTYPYKGGISHFTTLLVQNLRKEHKVDFISWKRQYPAFLYPVELKDTQSKNPIKTDADFILDYMNPVTWIQAVNKIKRQNPKKLIITWVSPIQAPIYAIIASLIKRYTKIEVIYLCHNVLPHEPSKADTPLAKLALSKGDSFIVHSEQDKNILEKLVPNKKIILGFHPTYDVFNTGKHYDVNKIKEELNLKKRVLLFFGYIRPYKGLKYLIEAMPDIIKKNPDTSLLIAGDFWSKDKQSYFDLVNKLGIEKNVVFETKYVADEEVGKYFTISDIIIFPYTSATQSGTMQIATAFNKPIISTSVGGLKDFIKDDHNIITINSKDSKDIADKVLMFYKSKQKSLLNSKNTKTWDEYINRIELYD